MSQRSTPVFVILAVLLLVPTVASQAASTPYIVSIIDRDLWVQADSVLPVSYAGGGDTVTFCVWVDPATGADDYDGGFDFLIGYDAGAMSILSAERGADLHAEWEYFSFRADAGGGCASCPSGLLRVVGLCDMNNGTTPPDAAFNLAGCVVELTFAASVSPAHAGLCHPVDFYAIDCSDNVIASRMGDSLYLPASGVMYDANYDSAGCPATGCPYIHYTGGQICITGTNVPPDTLPAPYQVRIIDRNAWVSGGATESLSFAVPGDQVTACLWIDPGIAAGRVAGGFDFLVCYDNYALSILDVDRGADLQPEWEYFTYRLGNASDSCPACPQGLIRVVGIADLANSQFPPPEAFALSGCVAELTFLVTTNGSYIGTCGTLAFCAFDCGDNVIASRGGDTLFVPSEGVIAGNGYDPASCVADSAGHAVPGIAFQAGGICITEPAGPGGDLNLNGIAYEIGDAVLYSNFMIYGTIVLDLVWNPVQIAESEMNCDSLTATLADLAYLWNVITGDLQPCLYSAAGPGPEFSDHDTIGVVSTAANAGDTITIDFCVRNTDTLNSFNFRLLYDPVVLEPIISDTLFRNGDTALTLDAPEQLRGNDCEIFGAGIPEPGVLTFLASNIDGIPVSRFLPGGGPTVRTLWRVLPSATPQVSDLRFEDGPAFPNAHNTMIDIHAAIWKRPVMAAGYVSIGGAACDCPSRCDYDADGFLTALDLGQLIDVLFAGRAEHQDPNCPTACGDFDADLGTTTLDLSKFIDHLFAGRPGPCNPCAK